MRVMGITVQMTVRLFCKGGGDDGCYAGVMGVMYSSQVDAALTGGYDVVIGELDCAMYIAVMTCSYAWFTRVTRGKVVSWGGGREEGRGARDSRREWGRLLHARLRKYLFSKICFFSISEK